MKVEIAGPETRDVSLLQHSIYQIKSQSSQESKGAERDSIFDWDEQHECAVRERNVNSYIKGKSNTLTDSDNCSEGIIMEYRDRKDKRH